MLFFTDEGMKWNKLIKYGELLLSLLVVFLMLLASVVYGGYLFGEKIGGESSADSLPQASVADNVAPTTPAKPFHGDMTLEKLRAEDSLAANQKDEADASPSHDAEEQVQSVSDKQQATEKSSEQQKKKDNAKNPSLKTNTASKTSTTSAGTSAPNESQLSKMGLSDVALTAYDKGLWQVTNATGKVLGTVVSSEPFASGVKGFAGPTPVFVYVSSNGVVKAVVAADNVETPEFFATLADEGLFKAWNGKSASAAASMQVDGITGATFSSRAVIQNVQAALKHYHPNKAKTSEAKETEAKQSVEPKAEKEVKQTVAKPIARVEKAKPEASTEDFQDTAATNMPPTTSPATNSAPIALAAYGAVAPDASQMKRLGLQDVQLEVADTGVWNVKASDGKLRGTLLSSEPFTKHVKGYHGPTPLYLLLSTEGKVEAILPMNNEETPSFFSRLEEEGLFKAWNGKTVAEATEAEVDAVTGATFSSRSVIQNVRTALARYQRGSYSSMQTPVIGWVKTILVLVVLALGIVARYRFKKNKTVRIVVLALNVVVTGFFCGQFLSLGMLRSWISDGVDIIAVLPAFAMLVLTLVLGFFGKPNHHCTWVCPMGSLQELAYRLPLPKVKLKPRAYKVMRYVRLSVFLLLMLLAWVGVAIDGVLDYEPFSAFLVTAAAPAVIILALVFIAASIFVPSVWCKCFCVMGEALNLSQKKD